MRGRELDTAAPRANLGAVAMKRNRSIETESNSLGLPSVVLALTALGLALATLL